MELLARNRIELAYERGGSGDPPLVFVHGWCCDRTFFDPQREHFGASHEVVALDLRGCGDSSRPDCGYELGDHADDVAHLCRELGLERPVVVGHSLGGAIAVELAARHPGLAAAVVAVDPAPFDLLPERRREWSELADALAGADAAAVRTAFVEENFLPGDRSERRRRIVETMTAVPLPVARASFLGALHWDGVAALRACDVPLLVLLSETAGSNDPARLRALRPDVAVGVTVGAGHFNQLEVPEQVNAMIERFLAVSVR